jgi:hypothetical protein
MLPSAHGPTDVDGIFGDILRPASFERIAFNARHKMIWAPTTRPIIVIVVWWQRAVACYAAPEQAQHLWSARNQHTVETAANNDIWASAAITRSGPGMTENGPSYEKHGNTPRQNDYQERNSALSRGLRPPHRMRPCADT